MEKKKRVSYFGLELTQKQKQQQQDSYKKVLVDKNQKIRFGNSVIPKGRIVEKIYYTRRKFFLNRIKELEGQECVAVSLPILIKLKELKIDKIVFEFVDSLKKIKASYLAELDDFFEQNIKHFYYGDCQLILPKSKLKETPNRLEPTKKRYLRKRK